MRWHWQGRIEGLSMGNLAPNLRNNERVVRTLKLGTACGILTILTVVDKTKEN